MKNSMTYYLAKSIEAAGMIITFGSMCIDVNDNPAVAIPILIGLILLVAGIKIEKGWFEFEDDLDFEEFKDDTEDGITYITYDRDRSERYADSERVSSLYKSEEINTKEKVLPPTKVTEPIRERK